MKEFKRLERKKMNNRRLSTRQEVRRVKEKEIRHAPHFQNFFDSNTQSFNDEAINPDRQFTETFLRNSYGNLKVIVVTRATGHVNVYRIRHQWIQYL